MWRRHLTKICRAIAPLSAHTASSQASAPSTPLVALRTVYFGQHARTHTHTRRRTQAGTHRHTHAHKGTHRHTHAHTRIRARPAQHTYTHTHTHTHARTQTRAHYMRARSRTQRDIPTGPAGFRGVAAISESIRVKPLCPRPACTAGNLTSESANHGRPPGPARSSSALSESQVAGSESRRAG